MAQTFSKTNREAGLVAEGIVMAAASEGDEAVQPGD
jgi:hypothetical protein